MRKYQIYDGYGSLMFDYPEIEAKTGKEAIMILIKQRGYKIKNIKRSKDNDVEFKAEAFYEKNGQRFKQGRAIWYAPNPDLLEGKG